MNNFQRVWIVSGVIFGLGMIVLDSFLFGCRFPINVLTGMGWGIVSGLILGILAQLLFHSEKKSCFRHISTALLLTVAGFFLGIGSYIGLNKLPHGQWEQIISPPEKPVRFLGQSAFNFWGGSIYIVSENGNIYSYTCDSENPCNWSKSETPPSEPKESSLSCSAGDKGSHPTPLKLFKKVVDAYEVNICGPDYTNQINFIMLDDGTIFILTAGPSLIKLYPILIILKTGIGIPMFEIILLSL